MKHRRRKGASAAGVVVLTLLAAPAVAGPGRLPSGSGAPRPPAPVVRFTGTSVEPVRVADAERRATPAPGTEPPPTPCPVAGEVRFVDSWGDRRSGGRRHQGVDMLAARGTPVVAPADGVVVTRNSSVGGLSYHLTATDGTYYYGTHLSRYGAAGPVTAGTIIGYVGDSGNARGTPHLHFEIHPAGEGTPAVNPYVAVAQWCGAERVDDETPAH
jgi:murein DD-endopeptidase MepM/ murein hydrolase activator NlpD